MPSNTEPTQVRVDRHGLTEAEWAVAVILHEGCWCESERDDYEGCGPQSRGVDAKRAIAAVKPIIAAEALRAEADNLERAVPSEEAMPTMFVVPAHIWLRDRAEIRLRAAALRSNEKGTNQ